jgi:hypothetical protein
MIRDKKSVLILSMLVAGCAPPDPRRQETSIPATPVNTSVSSKYDVWTFTLPHWTPKKNFGLHGERGQFFVYGGETGLTGTDEATIYRYDENAAVFSARLITEDPYVSGRTLLPAVAWYDPVDALGMSWAVFGGASFVQVTKSQGVRSDVFSYYASGQEGVPSTYHRSLFAQDFAPRSGACMVSYPGGDFFVFGGENLGNALSSGAIISKSADVTKLADIEASTSGRYGHACVYMPAGGDVYVFGGRGVGGPDTSVWRFNRSLWRWQLMGHLQASRAGFYYYAALPGGVVILGESLSGQGLTASFLRPTSLATLQVLGRAGVDAGGVSLPYSAGEVSGPRMIGVFDRCMLLPVMDAGGMVRLQELCLEGDQTIARTDGADGLGVGLPVGVFGIPGSSSVIYVGTKSYYQDPLMGPRGLVVRRR